MRTRAAAARLLLAASIVATEVRGQGTVNPPRPTPSTLDARPSALVIEGRVVRGTARGELPVPRQMVVLHRIASDSAGPLDSTQTLGDGRYRFNRPLPEGSDAMFIASTRFAGVAYFTTPLRGSTSGADAEIVVFDTTSRPFALPVRGRHLILAAPGAGGARRVVDVFEIANDTSVTRVSGPGSSATWSVSLPSGARALEVGQGDVPQGAVRFEGGEARVFAPFAPGIKQLVIGYELPAAAFPIDVPMPVVTVLEVLLEEQGAQATGMRLTPQAPVTLEGRRYQRLTGEDVTAASVLRLVVPRATTGRARAPFVVAGLALLALALGTVAGRRRWEEASVAGTASAPRASLASQARDLVNAIAALDTVHASRPRVDAGELTAYQTRRAELKAQLVTALEAAGRDAPELHTPGG